MPNPTSNTLFYGDNLLILRDYLPSESVDLIYLDPPFNSNRSYNVLFKDESGVDSEAQITAFDDTWHWGAAAEQTYYALVTDAAPRVGQMVGAMREFVGTNQMMAYLVMMAARLVELHRVLKPTGSLYLHCDPTASHYLKIILDTIFGAENFRNEIVWKRTTAHSGANRWGDVHDILLFYSKSSEYVWNSVYQKFDESYLDSKYRYEDSKGKYRLDNLTGAGITKGDSSKAWKGYDPSSLGRHWAISRELLLSLVGEEKAATMNSQEKLDLLYNEGYIYIAPKGRKGGEGFPQIKKYLGGGVPIQGLISDIPPINSQAAERLGYPTQKPVALLERIVQASSNEGDVVLDPFCGCGTTIAAAQRLNRRWLGIDITHLSISLQKYRLKDSFNLEAGRDYKVIGEPEDVGSARHLFQQDAYQFQWWALSLIGAKPLGNPTPGPSPSKATGRGEGGRGEGKKGADKGVDGIITFIEDKGKPARIMVQVKGGHVKSGDVRDLRGVLDRESAALGLFVTLERPTKDMITEAVSAGYYESPLWQAKYPRLQILTIEDLLNGKRPDMPPVGANVTFQRAERVKKEEGSQGRLL